MSPRPRDPHAVFSGDIFLQQARGGVSRYFAELQRELGVLGISGTIATPLWITEYLESGDGIDGFRIPQPLMRFGLRPLSKKMIGRVESNVLRRLHKSGANVVLHRTNYTTRPSVPRVPHVLTVYDMIFENHPAWFNGIEDRILAKRMALESADQIIAISDYTRDQLLDRYSIEPNRVTTVPLAARYIDPRLSSLRELSKAPPFILYVGTRHGYKNFERLVRACSQSAAFRDGLRLIAFGGGSATGDELKLLAHVGLMKQVTFAAGPDDQLAAHYAAAVALVYPSLDEGFGLPPIEAMLYGCPILAASAGAMPEVLGDAVAYADPLDVDSWADGIDGLVFDEAHRLKLGILGRSQAGSYSWANTAAATLGVYREALGAFS